MKGKLLLNLALLAVVGILALLAFYQPGSKKEDEQPLLTDLKADQVTRIELQKEGQPATVLERNGARWRMLQPYAMDADEARVGFLLDFLGARSVSRFQAVESDLAKYELDRPHATLKLNDQRFDFGAQHPLMPNRYVRMGNTIHLVTDIINQHLMVEATAYVSPRLLEEGVSIEAITVPGLRIEQRDGKLSASTGNPTKDAIAKFIEEWRQARALNVRALTAEEQSAANTEMAKFNFADGGSRAFVIIKRERQLVLARTDVGLAYEFAPDVGARLLKLDATQEPR